MDLATVNVAGARLPQAYEAAKVALANCASVDECKDWADKAQALASYARQADDDSLQKHALRIQARAIRRCGELLKTLDARPTNASKQTDPADTLISRRAAAQEAGLSERQQVTAVRVANIPAATFEAAVEAEKPPTVTALADMGRQRRQPGHEPTFAPLAATFQPGFRQATTALATLAEFAAFCRGNDPELVAQGVHVSEVATARADVALIDSWMDRFIINVKG